MIQIREYDAVDALDVLHFNLLCLDFALTPELVATIRYLDPRPFPFFALYAREDATLVGQVGVFRLPVVSTRQAEEVGGVWALSTPPIVEEYGIADLLLDEAHDRMRTAGLRFSTVGTNRLHGVHSLYRKAGYEEVVAWTHVIATRSVLPDQTSLRAERAHVERLHLADEIFEQIARSRLGFARRHVPFFPFLARQGFVAAHDLWLLWDDNVPVGYAAAFVTKSILKIANLLLHDDVDPVRAVAAIVDQLDVSYAQVRVDRGVETAPFVRAGFRLAERDWGVFMVKPLTPDFTVDDFRARYGVNSGRFLLSCLDVT